MTRRVSTIGGALVLLMVGAVFAYPPDSPVWQPAATSTPHATPRITVAPFTFPAFTFPPIPTTGPTPEPTAPTEPPEPTLPPIVLPTLPPLPLPTPCFRPGLHLGIGDVCAWQERHK